MSDKVYSVNFKCPKCGHNEVQEKLTDVIFYSEVLYFVEFEDGSVTIEEYGDIEDSTDIAEVAGYMCGGCGEWLGETKDELFEWLKEHNMLEEENDANL